MTKKESEGEKVVVEIAPGVHTEMFFVKKQDVEFVKKQSAEIVKVKGATRVVSRLNRDRTVRAVGAGLFEDLAWGTKRETTHGRPVVVETGANIGLTESDQKFLLALAEELAQRREDGTPVLTDEGAPEELAARAVSALPQESRLAKDAGPFYDTPSLARWLGITRQALNNRVNKGQMLMCLTSDRQRVYPTWQFNSDGKVLPGISDVIVTFREVGLDGWTVAKWLNVDNPDLNGRKASRLLADGKVDEVVTAARRDVERMAH